MQLCYAFRNTDGRTIVVLTQRPKLDMEALFKRVIPVWKRRGSRFVFRQGNVLVPSDLQTVAAQDADSILIISDASRSPEEADAQSIR